MNTSAIFETKFAPARRATEEVLLTQTNQIQQIPLLDSIFSTVPNPVLILNNERQIVYANAALRQMLGMSDLQQILGLRPGEALNCSHAYETGGGCGTTEACSQCGAALAILKAQKGIANVEECRILTNSDDENLMALDLRVWATPMDFGDDNYTVFSLADISDEKRRRVLERIFFHDIINTAGAIQGLVDIYLTTDDPEELRDSDIHTMLAHASTQLVDEIQAQSQLMAAESGELAVRSTPFETKFLLEQLIDLYKNHNVADGRSIKLADDVQNAMIWSDRALLGRVIGNMIKNALEASSRGETVTVGCEQYFDYVRFWVHNAKVVPRHIQLQIFQRSFSTKGEGRGLGTYSMKLLTESYLQGRISFESTPEKGTIFMVTCPLEWREASVIPSDSDKN